MKSSTIKSKIVSNVVHSSASRSFSKKGHMMDESKKHEAGKGDPKEDVKDMHK